MRIYLDNCCYNRPYDDQTQLRISLESQAKLHIQEMIKNGEVELAASFMLMYENSKNNIEIKKKYISDFIEENCDIYIDEHMADDVRILATEIEKTGIKPADAVHTACSILAQCDYMITTDDRLLKYKSDRIKLVNPTEFIRLIGGGNDE